MSAGSGKEIDRTRINCIILKLKIFVLSVMFLTIMVTHLNAVTIGEIPDTSPKGKIAPPLNENIASYTYGHVSEIASMYPQHYEVIMSVLKCESGYVVNGEWMFSNQQSKIMLHNKAGDETGRENSWGVAQINLYWNPEVSKEQALDLEYSIKFLSNKLDKGLGARWTCWRSIYH